MGNLIEFIADICLQFLYCWDGFNNSNFLTPDFKCN